MAEPFLSLSPPHVEELRRLIALHLPEAEIWAHGSRVRGEAHAGSDLDLVARHRSDLRLRQGAGLRALRAALSESNLPFLVELLDWACLPAAFLENINARHVVLYSPEAAASSR